MKFFHFLIFPLCGLMILSGIGNEYKHYLERECVKDKVPTCSQFISEVNCYEWAEKVCEFKIKYQ